MKKLIIALVLLFTLNVASQEILVKDFSLKNKSEHIFAMLHVTYDYKDKCNISFRIENTKDYQHSFLLIVTISKKEYAKVVTLKPNEDLLLKNVAYMCNIDKRKIRFKVKDHQSDDKK